MSTLREGTSLASTIASTRRNWQPNFEEEEEEEADDNTTTTGSNTM